MTIVARTARCPCLCHDPAVPEGVDVRDVIEAALACALCIDNHCEVLLDEPPSRPLPMGDTYTAYVEAHPETEKSERDNGEGRED